MRYTKMHGAGNSFVLTEDLTGRLTGEDLQALALRLCSPVTGPGADGLIVLVPGGDGVDFTMRFYNSDGSLGEMCGNGARCAARYAYEHGLAKDPEHIRFLTTAGPVSARRISREQYQVRLNDPSVIDLERRAGGSLCGYVELGDPGLPQAVVEIPLPAFEDPDALREKGRALRWDPAFPKGTNVTFVSPIGPGRVRAVTFERGVEDFTLACGTGCGAAALVLILSGRFSGDRLEISMPGGELSVDLNRQGGQVRDILLTGPTAVVGCGTLDAEN